MSRSEAQKKADRKYYGSRFKQVPFKLNRVTDADIIAYLDSVDNVRGFLIGLIRQHIVLQTLHSTSDSVVDIDSLYPRILSDVLPKETMKEQQEKIKALLESRNEADIIRARSIYGLYGMGGK